MHKSWWVLIALLVIAVVGLIALVVIPAPKANAPTNNTTQTPVTGQASIANLVSVTSPLKNQTISSPLTVNGSARGTFYFEASFPVTLKDSSGNIIAQTYAQALDDWMTENYVPFQSTVTFPAQPKGSKGTLILKNDNPSGDPSRDIFLEIPITF
jgi:hypothetical protein